jgi:hypothetical protein
MTLGVNTRSIAVHVLERPYVSAADVTWPPEPGRIVISRNRLTPSILAHEITHCLVPTQWLFFAEGFATWMGCEVAGNCADICFAETDVDYVVRAHGSSGALDVLAFETIATCDAFAPDAFHRLNTRLAHASAASFLKWFCRLHPELPAWVASHACESPPAELERLSGLVLPDLERAWLKNLYEYEIASLEKML